jgi:hypothetical protein
VPVPQTCVASAGNEVGPGSSPGRGRALPRLQTMFRPRLGRSREASEKPTVALESARQPCAARLLMPRQVLARDWSARLDPMHEVGFLGPCTHVGDTRAGACSRAWPPPASSSSSTSLPPISRLGASRGGRDAVFFAIDAAARRRCTGEKISSAIRRCSRSSSQEFTHHAWVRFAESRPCIVSRCQQRNSSAFHRTG